MRTFCLTLAMLLWSLPAGAESLQLLLSPERGSCPMGGSPAFTLKVKNLGKRVESFTYYRPAFWYPSFVSTAGKVFVVQGEVYDGPVQPVKVKLSPGQTQELPTSRFTVESQSPGGNLAHWVTTAGEYRAYFRIQLEGRFYRSNTVKLRVTEH